MSINNDLDTSQLLASLSQTNSKIYYCQQRNLRMYFTTPTNRIEIQSPYPNYSQYELDMRRKAEILKYNNSNTTSQINNKMTKKQQYSSVTRNIKNVASNECPNISTPSSSSDIPGPLTYLTLNNNIPLYNFKSHLSRNYEEVDRELSNLLPPVIILNGSDVTINVGTEYVDLGAYSVNGEIVFTDTTNVNINEIGSYIVTYTTTDLIGLTTVSSRNVYVIDTVGPTMSIIGDSTVTHERFSEYFDLGVKLNDVSFTNIPINDETFTTDTNFSFVTSSIQSGHEQLRLNINCNLFSVNNTGIYTLFYNGKDNSENNSEPLQLSRTVIVVDTLPPICDISGLGTTNDPFIIERFDNFVEPGIIVNGLYIDSTQFDISQTTINGNVFEGEIFKVVSSNNININSYNANFQVNYTITDNDNNSTFLTRHVRVVDTTVPIISLIGDSVVDHEKLQVYVDDGTIYYLTGQQLSVGLNILDTGENVIVEVSNNIIVNNINEAIQTGTYIITYKITDEVGNNSSVSRTINVIDTSVPTVKLATLIVDGNIVSNGSSTIDPYIHERFEILDINSLFYVNIDISFNGNIYSAYTNNIYSNDDNDKNVNEDISYNLFFNGNTINENVFLTTTFLNGLDVSNVGLYQIKYTVNDEANNENAIIRYVSVVDTTPPAFSLNGQEQYNLTTGQTIVDPGIYVSYVGNITVFSINYNAVSSRQEYLTINREIKDGNNNIVNEINFNIEDTYILTYTVSDSYGNSSSKIRTISTQNFSVNLLGGNFIGDNSLERFTGIYNEQGLIVNGTTYYSDFSDGTINISITNNLDINAVIPDILTDIDQSYNVIYNVSDNIGNNVMLKRYVQVRDRVLPTIDLINNSNINIERSSSYIDYGVIIEGEIKMNNNNNIGGSFTTSNGEIITFFKTINLIQKNPTQFDVGFSWTIYDGYWSDDLTFIDTATILATDKNNNRSTESSNSFSTDGNAASFQPPNFYSIIDNYYTNDVDSFLNKTIEINGTFCPLFDGQYTFYTVSDDSSYLWIGEYAAHNLSTVLNALINNGGTHSIQERSSNITLVKGQHYPLRVIYGGNNSGGSFFSFYFSYGTSGKIYDFSNNLYASFNTLEVTNETSTSIKNIVPFSSYNIVYKARDEYPTHKIGDQENTVERYVEITNSNINDISIYLEGTTNIEYEFQNINGTVYIDPGINIDENLFTVRNEGYVYLSENKILVITVNSNVNTSSLGTYTYQYVVKDEYNNYRTFTRNITISNNTPPVVTMNGDENYSFVLDSNNPSAVFTEEGIKVENFVNPYATYTDAYGFGGPNPLEGIITYQGIETLVQDTSTGEPLKIERTINYEGTGTSAVFSSVNNLQMEFTNSSLGQYTLTYTVTNLDNNLFTQVTRTINVTENTETTPNGTYVVYWELFKLKNSTYNTGSYNTDNNDTDTEQAFSEAYGIRNGANINYYLGSGSSSSNNYDEYIIFNNSIVYRSGDVDSTDYQVQPYVMFLPKTNGYYYFDQTITPRVIRQSTLKSFAWDNEFNKNSNGIVIHFPYYFNKVQEDRNYFDSIDNVVNDNERYKATVIFEFDSRLSENTYAGDTPTVKSSSWEQFKGDQKNVGFNEYFEQLKDYRIDWWFYDRNPTVSYRWYNMTWINNYNSSNNFGGTNNLVNKHESWFLGIINGERGYVRPRKPSFQSVLTTKYSLKEIANDQGYTGFDFIYPTNTSERLGGQIYAYTTGPKHVYRHYSTNEKAGNQTIGTTLIGNEERLNDPNDVINTT